MKKVIGNMNYIKEDKYFNIQGCGTNPPTECCTECEPNPAGNGMVCTGYGCPPNCCAGSIGDVYETGSVIPGGGNPDIKITRGVPSAGSTDRGPRGQRQNFYNNASGVRGMNYLCDMGGYCDGDQGAKGGQITNSAQGRFAVDPTTIRPADRTRGSSRMVDSLPDEDLHASASGAPWTACTPTDGTCGKERARAGKIVAKEERRREGSDLNFDGSNRMFLDNDNAPTDLWFNQSGDNVITVGGDKYSFQPVLSWKPGCDTMDGSGDGIFPNSDCESATGVGGVPGLGVSALRWKNGVMY